jgi:hypothetical protein
MLGVVRAHAVLAPGRSDGRRCYACTCVLVYDQCPAIVRPSEHFTVKLPTGLLFAWRPGAYVTDWKLKGLRELSELSPSFIALAALAGV